jgi:hypothetical protein
MLVFCGGAGEYLDGAEGGGAICEVGAGEYLDTFGAGCAVGDVGE